MAEYDVNKGTKLGQLKLLAEKVKENKTGLSELKTKVEGLVTAGGEPNAIEKIKVNGQEQSITPGDKSVDIKVPTKVADLIDKDDYATKEEMNTKISSVYKPGGSMEFDSLPPASADNLGTVYNVEDAFDTDENFVENAGNHYPAGTNVVVIDASSGDYKYDVLAGFVDLTDYAKTADVVKKEGNKQLSTEDYTTADKQKLAGLTNYTHPASAGGGSKASDLYKIATDANGHVSGVTKVAKGDITVLGIPDTTEATVSQAGLMSADDKTKLDGIDFATDEEVQQMLDEVFAEV